MSRTGRRALLVSIAATLAACGGRTGLLVPEPTVDAPSPDAGEEPFIDVLTTRFAAPPASSPILYRFDPPTASFHAIGPVDCPAPWFPSSMAVERAGVAYVVLRTEDGTGDGRLAVVNTANGSCQLTNFAPGQHDFATTFAMAFSVDTTTQQETLYVAGGGPPFAPPGFPAAPPLQLATIDVATEQLSPIAPFNPAVYSVAALTSTGSGQLFGLATESSDAGSSRTEFVQIDKTTAQVTGAIPLTALAIGQGFASGAAALAPWGDDFYFFTPSTGPSGSVVTRFTPSTGALTQVATIGDQEPLGALVVGAAASPGAPQGSP